MEITDGSSGRQARRPGRPRAASLPPSAVDPAPVAALPEAGRSGRYRSLDIDGLTVRTDLPAQLPVSAAEVDLVRIYFGDLISIALKDEA